MKGWEERPFTEVVKSRGSGSRGLPKKEWLDNGPYPVIGQGAGDVEGWTDREDLLIESSRPMVLYGGHTRRAKLVSGPFVAGPNVKLLRPMPDVSAPFLYWFLRWLPIESKGYADHFRDVKASWVPVPPPPEQERSWAC